MAVIMVIFVHMMGIERGYSSDQIMGNWWDYMGVGIDIFFVISGFIMVYVTRDLPRGITHGLKFIFDRAFRIYPLYWLVSLALLTVFLIRPDLVFRSNALTPDIFKSFALWPQGPAPLLAIGWTLIYEMFFYIIFAVSFLIPRKGLLPFLLIWSALCLAGYNLGWAASGTVAGILFSPLTLEMLLGAFCALFVQAMSHRSAPKVQRYIVRLCLLAITTSALCIAATVYILAARGEMIMLDFARRVSLFALPCAIIITACVRLDMAGRAAPKILTVIGQWSYSIYLTHILTMGLMGLIWQRVPNTSAWDNVLWLPALFVGSIAGGGLVYRFAEKPLLSLRKTLRKRLFA